MAGLRPAAATSVGFLSQAFMWMFLGLLLSAFVAYLVQHNLGLGQGDFRGPGIRRQEWR